MSREEIIRTIVERELRKQPLSEKFVQQVAPELHAQACECFGTWGTALRYAGINQRRRRTQRASQSGRGPHLRPHASPNAAEILRVVRQLYLTGYDVRARTTHRRDPKLYAAAKRYFKSWKKTLLASQIRPKYARRTKTDNLHPDALLWLLRQRHARGLPMDWASVCFEDRGLALSVKYTFGSWSRALVALGLATLK